MSLEKTFVIHPPVVTVKVKKIGDKWCACITANTPIGKVPVSICLTTEEITKGLTMMKRYQHLFVAASKAFNVSGSEETGRNLGFNVKNHVLKIRKLVFAQQWAKAPNMFQALKTFAAARLPTAIVTARANLVRLLGGKSRFPMPGNISVDAMNFRTAAYRAAVGILGPNAVKAICLMYPHSQTLTGMEVQGASDSEAFKVISGEANSIARNMRNSAEFACQTGIPVMSDTNPAVAQKAVQIVSGYGKDAAATNHINNLYQAACEGDEQARKWWVTLSYYSNKANEAINKVSSGAEYSKPDGYGAGYGVPGFPLPHSPIHAAISNL